MALYSPTTDYDVYLFKEGTHTRLYRKFGAHLIEGGCHFAVWAPSAREVYVFGDFNGWDKFSHPMKRRPDPSGIWELFVPGVWKGCKYKYFVVGADGVGREKSDPFAFFCEQPPATRPSCGTLAITGRMING